MYFSSKGTKRKLQDEYPESSEHEDAKNFVDIQKLDELAEVNDKAAVMKSGVTKPIVTKPNVSKAVVPKVEPTTEPVKQNEEESTESTEVTDNPEGIPPDTDKATLPGKPVLQCSTRITAGNKQFKKGMSNAYKKKNMQITSLILNVGLNVLLQRTIFIHVVACPHPVQNRKITTHVSGKTMLSIQIHQRMKLDKMMTEQNLYWLV